MEPEIAWRCPECGAAVRSDTAFCPQCGKPQAVGPAAPAPVNEVSEIPASGKSGAGQNSPLMATQPGRLEPAPGNMVAEESRVGEVLAVEETAHATESSVVQDVETDARPKRHRLASAREAVGEKISPRVEKLRHASNVMLEEASYDPSLRFVLIAIVIFLISLFLFLLNRLLG